MQRRWIGLVAVGIAIDALAVVGYAWWQHRRHRAIIRIRPGR